MAPANTPVVIRNKIGQDVATILQMPEVQKRLESQGVVTIVSAPHEFDALIRADTDRFEKMLRQAGVASN